MSRNEKLAKLGNAIRDYRGGGHEGPGGWHWRQPPKPEAVARVHRWLNALGLAIEPSMAKINAFKTTYEMREWIRKL